MVFSPAVSADSTTKRRLLHFPKTQANQAGVAHIEAEPEAKGSETLWRSQICVVEAVVTTGKQKGRR